MLESHYDHLKLYQVNKSTPISVCARYFASQLYFADICKHPKDEIHTKARKFYLTMDAPEEHPSGFNRFEVIMAEALVLTHCYEEALFYIDEVLIKAKKSNAGYIDVALLESTSVLKTIVLAHTRKKMNALAILQDIDPSGFSFLSRHLMSILYLLIKRQIKPIFDEQKQLDHLIEETGFVGLSTICNPGTSMANKQDHQVPR